MSSPSTIATLQQQFQELDVQLKACEKEIEDIEAKQKDNKDIIIGGPYAKLKARMEELRAGVNKHIQKLLDAAKISDDQIACETFIKSNPNAYAEGDWVVWREGKQFRHIPASKNATLVEALAGVDLPCYCTKFTMQKACL